MRKIAVEILAVVALSVVLGTAVNFSLVRRFFSGEFRQGFVDREKYPGIRYITLAEAEDLFSHGQEAALFIDSRSREEYAAGHIPGALSLALEEHAGGLAEGEVAAPVEKPIVVYCEGGDCATSTAMAKWISARGFQDVRIFSGGFAEWAAAGLPVEKSE